MHRVRFTRHKLGPAICLMATLCVCCVAALADYDIPKYEIVTEPNIVYGRSLTRDLGVPVDLVLNAYLPKGAEAKDKPSIVFIHGNPGSNPYPGNRNEGFASAREYFVRRGFVCFVPSYQFFGLDEVKTAVRWVRANATRYGLDPTKISAVGHSLGGSHAASLDVTDDSVDPPKLPNDPANNSRVSARVAAGVCLAGALFQPDATDSSDGPLMFIQGTADTVNFPGQQSIFRSACAKAGIPFVSYLLEGVGHGIDLAKQKADGRTLNELIEQFLRIHVLHDSGAAMATITAVAKGNGNITFTPSYGMFSKGAQVQITAAPSALTAFGHWEGDAKGTENPTTITVNANKRVVAVFTAP